MDIQDVVSSGMDWTDLSQYGTGGQAIVSELMEL